MASEEDWAKARRRFASEDLAGPGPAGGGLGPLSEQFAVLTRALLDTDTVHQVLQQVVATARAGIPGADVVSITLAVPGGGYTTPVYTDPVARELDELQYQFDEGPCVEATRTPGPGLAICEDLGRGQAPYPKFGPAAAERGVHCMLAAGLFARGNQPRGALNVYAFRPHGVDDTHREVLALLAAHASIALARTDAVEAAALQGAQLREAINSRDVIGQAKGILMERRQISAEEAFEVLRRTSQELNLKLSRLAETIATHRDAL